MQYKLIRLYIVYTIFDKIKEHKTYIKVVWFIKPEYEIKYNKGKSRVFYTFNVHMQRNIKVKFIDWIIVN